MAMEMLMLRGRDKEGGMRGLGMVLRLVRGIRGVAEGRWDEGGGGCGVVGVVAVGRVRGVMMGGVF